MSRHQRMQTISSQPRPPQSLSSGTSFISSSISQHQQHQHRQHRQQTSVVSASLDRPSAIPAAYQKQQFGSQRNSTGSKARKPAVAYTGLTGAGYTLSGQPGRFLLPEKSVARAQDGAGTLDVWPAGKSALSASSAANKQERKRQRNRKGASQTNSSGVVSGGVQHETGSQPKLLQELEKFVESELNVLGVDRGDAAEPNAARLQVYREAFRHFMEEFRTYKPFLSAVKNEYDSVLDKYARRLHYIPALRARLSTMEASTKQRVRREADAHAAEIRRIKITSRATDERLKSLEKLNTQMIDDNVTITKELDLQRTRYLDMKTANVSIVASLKKKDLIINAGQGDKQAQEDRAAQLANQLEQLELKHDVVLIQLANLRNAHMKATSSDTHQNVERLEGELDAARKEQGATLHEHRDLAKRHSEVLALVEKLTAEREKLAQDLLEASRTKDADHIAVQSMAPNASGGGATIKNSWLQRAIGSSADSDVSEGTNYDTKGGSEVQVHGRGNSRKGRRKTSGGGTGAFGQSNSGSNSGSNSSGSGGGGGGRGNENRSSVPNNVWVEWVSRCAAVGFNLPPEYTTLVASKAKANQKKNNKKNSATIVTLQHVIHLMNGLLTTLENGSFIEQEGSHYNNNTANANAIMLTGTRGVPISELRRLMKRMPPWKRKKDGKVDTSDVTSITSVTTQKGDTHAEVDKSSMFYFVGRGVDPEIPKFLRFNGRVRNRHMSKADIERIVKIVWIRKEQSRNKDHLSDFFHTYLQDEFGPSQTIIAEQAYNIVHALERYSHDADCDMFLKILMGELPEQSFVDQQLLLQHLQVRIGLLIFWCVCVA